MKMNMDIPRLRMFAGPNGSGKSTLKAVLSPRLLGVYINPDEIEKEIKYNGVLDLEAYGVVTESLEMKTENVPNWFKQAILDKAEEKL